MTAEELAAAIRGNPAAMAAALVGSNGVLLEALNAEPFLGFPEGIPLEIRPTPDELNAALLLVPGSHYLRYMSDEFVNPQDVKMHYVLKQATLDALVEDQHRTLAKARNVPWVKEDDTAARAAAARRGGE